MLLEFSAVPAQLGATLANLRGAAGLPGRRRGPMHTARFCLPHCGQAACHARLTWVSIARQ